MVVLLFSIGLILQGCNDTCETTNTYKYYEPVYTSLEEIRSSVDFVDPEEIENPGKIYLYNQTIFINEAGKGIHVVDNENPSSPKIKGFINIPGNYDMAVKGDILYADSYMDLVTIDITDSDFKVLNRIEDVIATNNNNMGFDLLSTEGILTDWEEVKTVNIVESDCNTANNHYYSWEKGFLVDPAMDFSTLASSERAVAPGANVGTGGSMARFTIKDSFLYTINSFTMNVFNISSPEDPEHTDAIDVGWGIETIFPYKNSIFIGAQNGMHIYDVTNPGIPSFVSTYTHITSCDPVVVEGEFAYVTLRSGSQCRGFANQLDVINISNLAEPQLIKTYPMDNPHGLGISDNTLFVCEGEFGLKIYNSENKLNINENLLAHFQDLHAYDVIPHNQNLILIGKDGLYQYDFQDLEDIKLLSFLPVNPATSPVARIGRRN